MEPVVKKSKQIIAYKQWLSEKKELGKVIPIEFIGFKYKHYRTGKPYPFNIDGMNFVGEIWKCIDKDGNWVDCTFKHYIDNSLKTNSSLLPNRNPIQDGFKPNIATDSYEEIINNMVNKTKNPNKHLSTINKKHKLRIANLRNIISTGTNEEKEIAFYILRHKESPTLPTLRSVQKVRAEKAELYNTIMQKINL